MQLKLGPGIFDSFGQSDIPFFLMDGRLFTLEPDTPLRDGQDYYSFFGRALPLEESVSMDELEDLQIRGNKGSIDDYASELVDDMFVSRIRDSEKRIRKSLSLYSSKHKNTAERFLLSVIIEYLSLHRETRLAGPEDNKTHKMKFREFRDSDKEVPSIDDLLGQQSGLAQATAGRGIFCISKRVYMCRPDIRASAENEFFHVAGRDYRIGYHSSLAEFISAYKKRLNEKLRRRILEKSSHYRRFLREHEQARQVIEKAGSAKSSAERLKNNSEVYYKSLKGKKDVFRFYISRPPFIIEKYNNKVPYYFHFRQGFAAYINVRVTDRDVTFLHKPKCAISDYNHPFVWDDSIICFGNKESALRRWNRIGVRFGTKYSIEDMSTARRLAMVLEETRLVGEYGYINEPSAVKSLFPPSLHFSDEFIGNNRSEAERLNATICKNM